MLSNPVTFYSLPFLTMVSNGFSTHTPTHPELYFCLTKRQPVGFLCECVFVRFVCVCVRCLFVYCHSMSGISAAYPVKIIWTFFLSFLTMIMMTQRTIVDKKIQISKQINGDNAKQAFAQGDSRSLYY